MGLNPGYLLKSSLLLKILFRAYLVPILKNLPKINPTHPYVYKSGTLVAKSQTQLLSVTAVSKNSLKYKKNIKGKIQWVKILTWKLLFGVRSNFCKKIKKMIRLKVSYLRNVFLVSSISSKKTNENKSHSNVYYT